MGVNITDRTFHLVDRGSDGVRSDGVGIGQGCGRVEDVLGVRDVKGL